MTIKDYLDRHLPISYERIKRNAAISYRKASGKELDEDVFHDTLLKCADSLGGKDMTEVEIENYIYMAFRLNMTRESQYARNRLREEVEELPENTEHDSHEHHLELRMIMDHMREKFGHALTEAFHRHVIDGHKIHELEKELGLKSLRYHFRKIIDYMSKNYCRYQFVPC